MTRDASQTRRIVKAALAGGVALILLRAAAACVDMTPLYVAPREASVVDGAPCLSCLELPNGQQGCADEIAVCKNDPRCLVVYDCMAHDACLEKIVFDDKIACTLPCLQEAGIVSTKDPTVDSLLAIVKCGEKGCVTPCGLSEAGTNLGF